MKYAKILEEAGFSREQMEDKLATKQDVHEIKRDIQELDKKFVSNISQAKSEITIRMGAMFGAAIAILTAIQKLIH